MALRPIGNQSELEDVIKIVNDNFRDVENIFRVIQIKDDTGTNRIILGRLPDGTYGLVISKEGIDVKTVFS